MRAVIFGCWEDFCGRRLFYVRQWGISRGWFRWLLAGEYGLLAGGFRFAYVWRNPLSDIVFYWFFGHAMDYSGSRVLGNGIGAYGLILLYAVVGLWVY